MDCEFMSCNKNRKRCI